ncbi:TPA: hypothetical protein U0J94_001501 [Streptococcus suis]|uniref:Arsenate reductase n=1 Tax=Streptococcus suis TaxID=1307 RepID=A0AAP6A7P8_STRSU|nr:hypothetical protein [Streptococcus suis]MCB2908562.1 hypothetical protein [Streptococcus suis]MDN2949254.1 hypothetical protein [Streptococcus suis]MDW8591418.1 hypothetical protein [Streptococcus suis]MDW8601363.1 hypothetical protein [Streptococcus suis]MDW8625222.1 hypothetical protein [Streptococcus suis]
MLEIYLSRNTSRNQKLLSFCDSHGISYSSKEVSNLSREDLLGLFTKSSDCFTLLSSSLQRFKGHREMKLSELVTLVLRKPDQNLRLPIVVCEDKVYPDMSLEEARTFLPRNQKVVSFREHLFKYLVT